LLDEIVSKIKEHQVNYLHFRFIDNAGIIRTKIVIGPDFKTALTEGINFSKAIMSFTSLDEFIDNASYRSVDGDFLAIPDLNTFRVSSYQAHTAYVFCYLVELDGTPFVNCHRSLLTKLIENIETICGGRVKAAFEPEFMVLESETSGPVKQAQLFSVQRVEQYQPFLKDVIESAQKMGLPVSQFSSEASPQQFEINLSVQPLLQACDDWLIFRELVKVIGARHNYIATFLPKPLNGVPGNGLHLHLGFSKNGSNLFFENNSKKHYLSKVAYNFLGGLIAHGQAIIALGSASVNSYKRFVKDNWAPLHINWGLGNRSSFIRIPESIDNRHLEIRSGDATCSPYLWASGILAAGLLGIKHEDSPGRPCNTDGFSGEYPSLPSNLGQALDVLKADVQLRSLLGEALTFEYSSVKQAEWEAYLKTVTDWDKQFYTLF